MKVTAYEATVENGQIKVVGAVRLPEHARVYVVVPDADQATVLHVGSPHLAQPEACGRLHHGGSRGTSG